MTFPFPAPHGGFCSRGKIVRFCGFQRKRAFLLREIFTNLQKYLWIMMKKL